MVASGNSAQGYAATRWAQSIGMPQGSDVGRAVQLLVEEVAPARDCLHHEQRRRDDVRPAQERDALVARVQERRDRAGDDPAVDPEARVRGQDDLEWVVLVQRPLVDDVVEPPANQRRDGHDDDPVADDVGVLAGALRQADQQQVGECQADGIADPVPVDGERPDLKRDGIGGQVEHSAECTGRIAAQAPSIHWPR